MNFDILAERIIKINSNVVAELQEGQRLTREKKKGCKVLKTLAGCTLKDALKQVSELDRRDYQNLFVFVLKVQEKALETDENYVKDELEKTFTSFCRTREIIVQLTSENPKMTRIFYSKLEVLHEVMLEEDVSEGFSFFLRDFSSLKQGKAEKIEEALLKVIQASPDQLSLRFLTIFQFSLEFSFRVVSHCAEKLSKDHFLASIGLPFMIHNDATFTSIEEKILPKYFKEIEPHSVLEAATCNENFEIFDYLIVRCLCLIDNLPLEHLIKISDKLVQRNELEKLCDLLEGSDFPFPTELQNENERFQNIVSERKSFHEAIAKEDYKGIDKFIKLYPELSIAFSTDNKSAMYAAIKTKNVKLFCYLRERGYIGRDFEDLQQILVTKNIQKSLIDSKKSAKILAARSKIHHREELKNNEEDQREKIKIWLEAIQSTELGEHLINAACQCDKLQIIFDFGRSDVSDVDLDSPDADGITYADSNLIIISANYLTRNPSHDTKAVEGDKKIEQTIKGVLAHELAHYVIGMVFDNEEQPYFNELDPRYQKYKEIVDKYRYLKSKGRNDGCDGIISKVYRNYEYVDYFAELIVRPFQILSRYDDDLEKVSDLKKNYPDLFDFASTDLVEEMKNFKLTENELVKVFNNFSGVLSSILENNLKLPCSDAVRNMLENNLTVATANVPKLLFFELYNCLLETQGNLVGSRNIFVDQKSLSKKEFRNAFKNILKDMKEVKIFVSIENFDILKSFDIPTDQCFVIIASNVGQSKDIMEYLDDEDLAPAELNIDYAWKTLTADVQAQLLECEVNFQNNSKTTLLEIFGKERDLSDAIDTKTLNTIVNDSMIHVNPFIGLAESKSFELLYIQRALIRINETGQEGRNQRMEVEKLKEINELFDEPIVLVSDVAGSGKSWTMRNLAIELADFKPTNWLTFVDLKQFISYFKSCIKIQKDPNFDAFMVEKVLEKLKLEAEIFKLKYEKGEAAIFLDGFDEIAPDCADYVRKLIKTFNSFNQLFISTRDYFDVELQNELDINFTVKLDSFTEKDSYELIARIWSLNDFEDLTNINLEKDIIGSEKYKEYLKLAEKLFKEFESFWNGIGLPQIYSMIAKITKQTKTFDEKLTTYQLYLRMYKMAYEEWSNKNEIRKDLNAESQQSKLNFLKLHELKAMEKFDSKKLKYCDINAKDSWTDVHVDGCGLMSKIDDEFFFNHETFYEFFVAEFIIRNLRDLDTVAEAFEFVKEVILNDKHQIIRKFLDEGFENERIELRQKEKNGINKNIFDELRDERTEMLAGKMSEKFVNSENVYEIFTKKLRRFDSLGAFLVEILKKCRINLEETLFDYLHGLLSSTPEIDKYNFQRKIVRLVISSIDLPTLINVADKLNERTNLNFIKDLLNLLTNASSYVLESAFWCLPNTELFIDDKFEKLLKFMSNFLTPSEVADKLRREQGALKYSFRSHFQCFKVFLRTFKKFFEDELTVGEFRDILTQREVQEQNCFDGSIFFHEIDDIWHLMFEMFEDDFDGLRKIIIDEDSEEYKYHFLTESFLRLNQFDFAMVKLKNVLDTADWDEILKFKTCDLIISQIHWLWDIKEFEPVSSLLQQVDFLRESKQRLLEVFTTSDFYGNSFINNPKNIVFERKLKLALNRLEDLRILLRDEVKELLSSLNKFDQNFLQVTALYSFKRDLNAFNGLDILREFFTSAEIVKFVKERDIFGYSYFDICLLEKSIEKMEVTISEIFKEMTESGLVDEQQVEKLRISARNKVSGKFTDEDLDVLSLDWVLDENSSKHPRGTQTREILQSDNQKLKELLLHKNEKGVIYIHQEVEYPRHIYIYPTYILLIYPVEYIQSIIEKAEKELNADELKELFMSTNKQGMNLVQVSVENSKTIDSSSRSAVDGQELSCLDGVRQAEARQSFYLYLWKLMRQKFDNQSILAILRNKDENERNLLLTVAHFGTKEVVEITWKEIEEISECASPDFRDQIIEMINIRCKVPDVNGSLYKGNILHAVTSSEHCTLKVHLEKIANYLKSQKGVKKLLTEISDSKNDPTILFYHIKCNDKSCHEGLWTALTDSLADQQELFDFVMTIGHDKHFIYEFIERRQKKSVQVFDCILETLKDKLGTVAFQEILMTKNFRGQYLLQSSFFTKTLDVEITKTFWTHYKKLENFLEILTSADKNGKNIMHIVAWMSSAEVIDFFREELKVLNESEKVRELMFSFDENDDCLMFEAAYTNKRKSSHESLWKLLREFLSENDILLLVKHTSWYGKNILQTAVRNNVPEVVEYNWNQIKTLMTKQEQSEFFAKRDGDGKSLKELAYQNEDDKVRMIRLVTNLQRLL